MSDSPARPRAVLFACTMNAVRSPMAAALLRAHAGGRIEAASAGLWCGDVDPFVPAVMAECGLDVSGHEPQALEALEPGRFDLVVALSLESRTAAEALGEKCGAACEYWPMPDPTLEEGSRERRLEAYRELRAALVQRIAERFPA